MTSPSLENLVETGQIKREGSHQREFEGLVLSGRTRLKDAGEGSLSLESRFDLAYNAAHALSLAALRWHGYRAGNRYVVFQCLPHTLGVGPEVWRTLAQCHNVRNTGEYEGFLDLTEQLVHDLINAAAKVLDSVEALGPVS